MLREDAGKKIDYADRKCNICDDIDDEYHFLVHCTRFHNLKIKYSPKPLYTNPSMIKFIQFLNSKDINKINFITKFSIIYKSEVSSGLK